MLTMWLPSRPLQLKAGWLMGLLRLVDIVLQPRPRWRLFSRWPAAGERHFVDLSGPRIEKLVLKISMQLLYMLMWVKTCMCVAISGGLPNVVNKKSFVLNKVKYGHSQYSTSTSRMAEDFGKWFDWTWAWTIQGWLICSSWRMAMETSLVLSWPTWTICWLWDQRKKR